MKPDETILFLDTTLRDGEQTSGVSFTDQEKLSIAKLLLDDLGVDRVEIASAFVSKGELEGARRITQWAAKKGLLERIEILGFVDNDRSIKWIKEAGGQVLNLLCKGSSTHCTYQLKKTKEAHVADIRAVLDQAKRNEIRVNVYLEDWSNGIQDDPDYVYFMVDQLRAHGVNRFMLPDTLGILNHQNTYKLCKEMKDWFPDVPFDFHGHNDYDLSVANIFEAIRAGIRCIHTTLNGLGERAGNTPLSSAVAVIKDHLQMQTNIREENLYAVCKIVESYSGVRIPQNKPVIGESVFTQTSGIHADGDQKHNLYHNKLSPERFNRKRQYALGKLAGKASLKQNLDELGIELDPESLKVVTQRINELGDRKEMVTKEDLPYIIADVLDTKQQEQRIQIINYSLSVAAGLNSVATLKLQVDGKEYEQSAAGDGQYDAFMRALYTIYDRLGKPIAKLVDYTVTIPPGGKTDALCHTAITWQMNERRFTTIGLDPDQAIAAIKATTKMLNLLEYQR
ncbi:MAG: alpha-isopropylmalate synthase regulatory domain-containing protein [Saprospiraceae bacterium]